MSSGTLFDVGTWWDRYWGGMPEFVQEDQKPTHSVEVLLRSAEDVRKFEALAGRIYHDKWLWYPEKKYGNWRQFRWVTPEPVLPRYPVYVPTKGRHATPYTIRTLEGLGIPFHPVVEEPELEAYAKVVKDPSSILVLPHQNKGLVVTRNWIWDHAAERGSKRFWTFDDNIQGLYRLNRNAKVQPTSGVFLRAIEDWVDRYENVPITGMQYEMFATRRDVHPALDLNTRVYSNMLLETDYREEDGRPFRNEGFYNDDTDLCLRALKRGHCTALFYAFLINKIATMTVAGGMTTHYVSGQGVDQKWRDLAAAAIEGRWYQEPAEAREEEERLLDGRWRMAAELAAKHPDVTTITRKWGRWQHQVDYSRFARNQLRLREGVVLPTEPNQYGMTLERVAEGEPEAETPKGRHEFVPSELLASGAPVCATCGGVQGAGVHPPVSAPVARRTAWSKDDWTAGPSPKTQVELISAGAAPRPMPAGWRPDEPPSLSGVTEVMVDFESTGLKWWDGDVPVGVAVSWFGNGGRVESRYLPWRHTEGNLDEARVREWFRQELKGKHVKNLNTRFDGHMARVWGEDLRDIAASLGDVGHYAALLNDHRRAFSLESVAQELLGVGKVQGVSMKQGAGIYAAWQVDDYARMDTELVARILEKQRPLMAAEDLLRVADLEDSVIPAVIEMEANGFPFDIETLNQWVDETERELTAKMWALNAAAGFSVNPDRPADLARLFASRGFQSDSQTPGGKPSYADDVMERFAAKDEAIRMAREAGQLAGFRSKFLLPYQHAGRTGLIRYSLNQLRSDDGGTVSGRFSSSQPIRGDKESGINAQQVMAVGKNIKRYGPKRVLRTLFKAPPGRIIAAPDAKQIEFRILVELTRSARLIKKYEEDPDTDFHAVVGQWVQALRPDFDRKVIKTINFQQAFGGGATSTAGALGVPKAVAQGFINTYNEAFPEIKALLNRAMEVAKTRGYVKTALGRRTRFPERQRLHKALNGAVQGTAADINKMKLAELYRERKRLGLTLRLTLHDEAVGDVPDQEAARQMALLLDQQSLPGRVPILWDMKTGPNWGACG